MVARLSRHWFLERVLGSLIDIYDVIQSMPQNLIWHLTEFLFSDAAPSFLWAWTNYFFVDSSFVIFPFALYLVGKKKQLLFTFLFFSCYFLFLRYLYDTTLWNKDRIFQETKRRMHACMTKRYTTGFFFY